MFVLAETGKSHYCKLPVRKELLRGRSLISINLIVCPELPVPVELKNQDEVIMNGGALRSFRIPLRFGCCWR